MAQAGGAGGPSLGGGAPWHLRNVLGDSVESSDDEFFDAREEMAEGKNAILIGMSQWNSNDLVEQIETMGKLDEPPALPGALPYTRRGQESRGKSAHQNQGVSGTRSRH